MVRFLNKQFCFNETRFMRKSIFKKRFFVFAFALITIVTACIKNKTTPVLVSTGSSIAYVLKHGTNLTILDSGMSKAGLLPTLDSLTPISVAGPFTIFAPVDIAFMNAGIYDSTINKYPQADLERLMLYHIYAGAAKKVSDWASVIGGQRNYPVLSASGDYFFLTLDSTGFYVNGNFVTQTDVIAQNGVIQALSGVLKPPIGNIYATLDSLQATDTTLIYVVAALNRASQSQLYAATLDSLLSNKDSLFTFFAPTNNAFRLTADSTPTAISTANPDSLARLLITHIVRGRVFSSDFPTDSLRFSIAPPTIALPSGDSLFFTSIIGNTIQSSGDSTTTSFLRTNILATNGVIHKVSQVLFPFYPF